MRVLSVVLVVMVLNITTINLSDGQLAELRKLGVENISKLTRFLIQQHIKRLRGSKKEYVGKKERAHARLLKAEHEWFVVELARARELGDVKAIKFYEAKLLE